MNNFFVNLLIYETEGNNIYHLKKVNNWEGAKKNYNVTGDRYYESPTYTFS
jgi:hypothetical protein